MVPTKCALCMLLHPKMKEKMCSICQRGHFWLNYERPLLYKVSIFFFVVDTLLGSEIYSNFFVCTNFWVKFSMTFYLVPCKYYKNITKHGERRPFSQNQICLKVICPPLFSQNNDFESILTYYPPALFYKNKWNVFCNNWSEIEKMYNTEKRNWGWYTITVMMKEALMLP